MTDNGETNKDVQITSLITQAESLVSDLNNTVAIMKQILASASEDIRGAKDVQHPGSA
jgi:hypothetical protein